MAQRIVSNAAQLKSALSLAKSGDVILLEDGDYGTLDIKNRKFSDDVTIASMNPQGATFTNVDIRNSSHLTFLGIDAGKEFRASVNSSDIAVDGVKTQQFYFRDVDGLTVDHSEAAGGWYNLVLLSVKNFSITNSYFHGATEDVARIVGNTHNGILENNIFAETKGAYPLHPDLMQMFKFDGATPHDLVIRGNLLWDDPSTGNIAAQGIFMTDAAKGGYSNILIEQNLISVGSPNSIYIDGGQENVVIRDNTLIDELGSKGATIRLAKKTGFDNSGVTVENNIARSLIDETKKSDIGDNYLYHRTNPDTLFEWNKGGSSWADYLPLKGTGVDFGEGYGATARLTQLIKDETFWKSGYETPDFTIPDSRFDPLYMQEGHMEFSGALSRIKVLPTEKYDFTEGTLAFSFESDIVGWRRTLISTNETDTNGSFLVRINNGTLELMFKADGHEQVLSMKGIQAHREYDFQASFDEAGVQAWLDGNLVGKADFDVDLSDGTLLLGADNSHLGSSSISGARYPFDGTITNFLIEDEAMTPAQLQAQLATIGLA